MYILYAQSAVDTTWDISDQLQHEGTQFDMVYGSEHDWMILISLPGTKSQYGLEVARLLCRGYTGNK